MIITEAALMLGVMARSVRGVQLQNFTLVIVRQAVYYGPMAQMVSASPCHGEGRRFEFGWGRAVSVGFELAA